MTKNSFVSNTELYLKIGTVMIGLLYVLGLLVSNMQLMEFGISDFTSLQVRNVMTGVLFLFYIALLLLTVAPISLVIYIWGRVVMSSELPFSLKAAICFGTFVGGILVLAFVVQIFGLLAGYTYPWGREWDAGFSINAFSWQFVKSDFLMAYSQLLDTFAHKKTIVVSIFFTVALLFPLSKLAQHFGFGSEDQDTKTQSWGKRFFAIFNRVFMNPVYLSIMVFASLCLLLVGFANEVYPNMKYNIGGGQPVVAELQIGTDKPASIRLLGIDVSFVANQADAIASTEAVVIWYRSDQFLYVTPLSWSNQTKARLVAIDIKMVRTILYLSQSVRVGSGGRILDVHSD